LLFELRPDALMNADLATLLPYLVDSAIARTKAHVEFSLDEDVELTSEAKVVFYRIAQEALNNIVKHAHASEIAIGIYQTATEVIMRIADDGVGFDTNQLPSGHFGLGIMQERARMIGAELEVDTAPEQGTTIVLHWKRQH
ncbi:MAG: histidine kinase, partial [Anaerolineae bacterium]